MDLYEIIDQVVALLQQRGRLTYRRSSCSFSLDDEQLEALKEELIDVQEVAADKDGKMLVWKGDSGASSAPSEARGSSSSATPPAPPPASYTPPHLAERIRAEQAALEARGAHGWRAQDHHRPLCRSQRLDGAD